MEEKEAIVGLAGRSDDVERCGLNSASRQAGGGRLASMAKSSIGVVHSSASLVGWVTDWVMGYLANT